MTPSRTRAVTMWEQLTLWAVQFKVPCTMTVQEVIMAFGGDKKSVITEFVEQGDGKWSKGQTIRYDSKEAEDRIGVWGWGGTRGSVTAPVWVVVYPTARG